MLLEEGVPFPLGFRCGSAGKESTSNAGDPGLILGLDPLEKGKATHSSITAWRIPPRGHKELETTE